jgi:anti-sigma regulatory factor (Ser/Thr protein kinase)
MPAQPAEEAIMSDNATLTVPTTSRSCGVPMRERTYPGRAEHVGQARADIREFLRGCPVTDDVVALVSELSANAVTHSGSRRPRGTFTLRVQNFPGDYVYAEVEDEGSSWHGDLARSAESPHGLHIVQMLATTCGVDRCMAACIVWFTIDYPEGARAATAIPEGLRDPFLLQALRATCPDFCFRIIDAGGRRRIEAVRLTGNGSLYAVITEDAAELLRVLRLARRDSWLPPDRTGG